MWKAIMEDSKKKDKKILELEEKLNKIMEEKHEKTEKEAGKALVAWCSNCGEALTQEDTQGTSCPKCGSGKFNTYPR